MDLNFPKKTKPAKGDMPNTEWFNRGAKRVWNKARPKKEISASSKKKENHATRSDGKVQDIGKNVGMEWHNMKGYKVVK